MTLRAELLEIQKRLVDDIKAEIYASVLNNKNITRYYEEYKSAVSSYERLSNRDELNEEAASSDLIFIGDYHTLRQSQKVFVRLLENISKSSAYAARKSGITICLEMLPAKQTSTAARYLAGKMTEDEFLDRIAYAKNWGFPWPFYKSIFDLARTKGFAIVGLNTRTATRQTSLHSRDAASAKIIASEVLENPDKLVAVLFGDLHVARTHLPEKTRALIPKNAPQPKTLIVYQNVETFYWQLAEKELEHIADVLKVEERAFAVMSTPPLAKFQSHLNWQENCEELNFRYATSGASCSEAEVDLSAQVHQMVKAISEFLGLPCPVLDSLTVYSLADLDLFKKVLTQAHLSPEDAAEIRTSIQKRESSFIPFSNVVLLSNLSINHAAEEAAHYLYFNCSGATKNVTLSRADKFYYLAMRAALGYFGSKLINHKRLCWKQKDFELFIVENLDRKPRSPKLREVRDISLRFIRHKEYERMFFADGEWKAPRDLIPKELSLFIEVARALGYVLGEKLYSAMIQDFIKKDQIVSIFCEDYSKPGKAFERYLAINNDLRFVKDLYESKTEKM